MCEDGDVVELTDDGAEVVGRVPAGYLYVDGIVGDVGQGVLRDRQALAAEGVVVVVVAVDIESGKVITGPEIITRGWVYAPEAEDLLDEACDRVVRRRRGGVRLGHPRRRGARARGAPGGRALRERADQAAPDDRPRRHGGMRTLRRAGRTAGQSLRVTSLLAVSLLAAVLLAGCSGGEPASSTTTATTAAAGSVLRTADFPAAVAAVEAERGPGQRYVEINATPEGVNVFVAVDASDEVAYYFSRRSPRAAGRGGAADVDAVHARRHRSGDSVSGSCGRPRSASPAPPW